MEAVSVEHRVERPFHGDLADDVSDDEVRVLRRALLSPRDRCRRDIDADKLEVREQESIAVFTGNVNVVQGDTLLKAGLMTVYYAKGGGSPTSGSQRIERLEVRDKVYLKSKDQVATGDEGNFDVASNTLVLTGKEVVLTEGVNVAKGKKLTVNTQTGKSQLEGRVQVLITPGSQGSQGN